MKKIAVFVVLAYAALFIILTWPVLMAAFFSGETPGDGLRIFSAWEYWVFIGVLLLCQAGLLLIPVKITGRRPVSRKHIFLPVIVSGFLVGALCLGVLGALYEFVYKSQAFDSARDIWFATACCTAIWALWGFVFCRLADGQDPRSVLLSQCRRLLQGSVIALLVAVPTHIVTRGRDYCCAGFYTFIGITFGLAVMLLSFGPGIYFLYAERWRKLHPEK